MHSMHACACNTERVHVRYAAATNLHIHVPQEQLSNGAVPDPSSSCEGAGAARRIVTLVDFISDLRLFLNLCLWE